MQCTSEGSNAPPTMMRISGLMPDSGSTWPVAPCRKYCPRSAKAETGKYFLVPLFSALQTLLKQGSHSLRIVTTPEQQKKSLLNNTPTPPQERGLMLPETADITLFQVLENQVQHFVQSGLQHQSRQLSDNGARSLGA